MIYVYTDGSARPVNPGPSGWAFLLLDTTTGNRITQSGGVKESTNNRMELTAVIKALEHLVGTPDTFICLYSDSEIVVKGVNEWLPKWKRRGWRKPNGQMVSNIDLWMKIDELLRMFTNLSVTYVKAHDGNKYNTIVDGLAANEALKWA